MKKLLEFYKNNRYAILWTLSYFALVWFILMFMFGFNIFVLNNWALLGHARIHGFAGFVFCILILATLPMYIATTAIIMRTRKPLVTININKLFAPVITAIGAHPIEQPAPQNTTSATQAPAITATPDAPSEFPDTMPTEVRNAFIRARQNLEHFKTTSYNRPPEIQIPEPSAVSTSDTPGISDIGDIPLPTDFDIDDAIPQATWLPDSDMPVFTDISFGDTDTTDDIIPESDTPTEPAPTQNTVHTDTTNDVIQYLTAHGRPAQPQGDLVISRNLIIATHNDPDFWIADPETWFAAGKQKPSPIIELIKASAQTKSKPVFYLAKTNIMDLDTCRTEWVKMGITVITDLAALPD